ncbi:MAG TPA: hypothetical protein VHF22_11280, partial [Planctomycetota bacterium]|nr:hypothetical protein [Planctomycetota bacterium]
KAGSAPADGDTWSVDTHPHKKGTSATSPDQFTVTVTQSAKGKIQDAMRRYHGGRLHSTGSPTFPDAFLFKGSQLIDGGL